MSFVWSPQSVSLEDCQLGSKATTTRLANWNKKKKKKNQAHISRSFECNSERFMANLGTVFQQEKYIKYLSGSKFFTQTLTSVTGRCIRLKFGYKTLKRSQGHTGILQQGDETDSGGDLVRPCAELEVWEENTCFQSSAGWHHDKIIMTLRASRPSEPIYTTQNLHGCDPASSNPAKAAETIHTHKNLPSVEKYIF